MPIIVTILITAIMTFVATASSFDTYAASFKAAEKACNERASGSAVRSFDFETATCENKVVLDYRITHGTN